MEIESLFSSTRWEILRLLSQAKLSPIELAEKIKTTSANISQQLRLLELGGLVKSERTSNTDKGKPRIIYSISADTSFVIMASPNFTDKKMLPLTSFHKFMMKAWFIDNVETHSMLGELYFRIKDHLTNIKIISYKENCAYIVSESQKSQDSIKKLTDDFKKVKIQIIDFSEFNKKYDSKQLILYDPKGIYSEIKTEVGKNE